MCFAIGMAVRRTGQERSQDEEIEGAAEEIDARRRFRDHRVGSLHNIV